MAAKIAPIQIARRISLGITLVGMTVLSILHQTSSAAPSIDALDPFGGLETLMKFLAGGDFIKKIEPGTFVLFGGIVVLGILVSRFFCGWICAFGALQGVFGWLGKKIFRRRFTVPVKLDKVLRWAKYPILAAIVYFTWTTASLVIRPYDPLAAYGHLAAGFPALWLEFGVGFVILVAVLLLSMLYERVFCKYLCPLGAFNAILSRIPIFRIKRKADTCISCSKCDRSCSMNVQVSTAGSVDSPECIGCLECVTACPTSPNSLETSFGKKKAKILTVVIVGFAVYIGAALVGQSIGMFRFSAPSLTEIAREGSLDIADIKGSSSYQSIADSFGVELDKLYAALGLDAAKVPPATQLKSTASLMGWESFEPDAVRVAVAALLGIPYVGEEEAGASALPAASEPASPNAATESKTAIPPASKTSSGSAGTATGGTTGGTATTPPSGTVGASAKTAASPLVVPADFELEGTMSIDEVALAVGASAEAVIEKLGLPASIPRDQPLRDLKDEYGYKVPELKERFK